MPARNIKPWLWLAVALIVLDQISKWIVLGTLRPGETRYVAPFFNWVLTFNPGAAFSFLADQGGWQRYFFLLLAVIICSYLAHEIIKDKFGSWGKWGAAMVIGGAVGNVVDRLLHGHVIDFLLFYWQNWFYPAFNIADSFICVGVVLMLIDGFRHKPVQAADDKKPV